MNRNRGRMMAGMGLLAVGLLLSGCGKADDYYEKGMDYLREGRYEDANEQFTLAIEDNSGRAEYYIGQGMALNFAGRYEEALKVFRGRQQDAQNRISDENNKQMYYGEAVASCGLGDYAGAISACDSALEIDEKSGMDNDIRRVKAAACELAGDNEKALQLYEENIKQDEKDVESYLGSGRVQLSNGQYDAAQEDFERAIQLDKDCTEAFFGCYDICMAKSDQDAAQKALEPLLSGDRDSAADYIAAGRAYYLLERDDEALECFSKAVESSDYRGLYYQGLIAMRAADYEEAEAKFQDFLEKGTGSEISPAQAYNQLAGCMMEKRQFQEAVDYLEDGLSYGRTTVHEALSRNLVLAYEKMGKYKKARKAAKTYLEAYPGQADMQKELKFIRTRIGGGGKKQT